MQRAVGPRAGACWLIRSRIITLRMGSPSVLIIIIRTLRDLLIDEIYCRRDLLSSRSAPEAAARRASAATPVPLCLQATAAPGYP